MLPVASPRRVRNGASGLVGSVGPEHESQVKENASSRRALMLRIWRGEVRRVVVRTFANSGDH
jgi:hypothetical protein